MFIGKIFNQNHSPTLKAWLFLIAQDYCAIQLEIYKHNEILSFDFMTTTTSIIKCYPRKQVK